MASGRFRKFIASLFSPDSKQILSPLLKRPEKPKRLVKLYDLGAIKRGEGFRTSDGRTYVHAQHHGSVAETGFFVRLRDRAYQNLPKKQKSRLKREWRKNAEEAKRGISLI